jgi:hypothetical protein
MMYLIIMCLLAEDKVCSWERRTQTRSLALAESVCAFFCGDGLPARLPCNARKHRDAHLAMCITIGVLCEASAPAKHQSKS